MKRILFAISFLLSTAILQAQIFEIDTSGDYESRFTKLSKAYAKAPEDVDNLYNLALFYFDNSHPMRNLPMAMQYIQRAEKRHTTLLEENRIGELTRLARKDITLITIRQTKQSIIDAAYNTIEVRTDMSKSELDSYMQAFGIDINLVRLLRQRRINQVYDEDLRKGTPQSYYHFIDTYYGTNEAEEMEQRLAKLAPSLFEEVTSEDEADSIAAKFPLSQSIARAALKQKSRIAYAVASNRNTVYAYKNFMRKYPSSDEYTIARDRVENLLENNFAQLRNARDFADFADSNYDNALADRALAQIRRLITEKHDIEAAQIYLKRFKSDPYYTEVFARYYAWHTVEGNSDPIRVFLNKYPEFPFVDNVSNDLQRGEEIDHINLLEDFLEVEYSKYATNIRRNMDKGIAFVALQRTLQVQLAYNNYSAAIDRVKQFELCFEKTAHDQYVELQRVLRAAPTGRKLTPQLSATYDIINPVINAEDGRLYFTRGGSSQKICYAVKQGNTWRPAGKVEFTNAENEGLTIFSFYADGSKMLLGSGGDILIAERDGDNWRIADNPPPPINSDYNESDAYMLPDGTGMLFVSDRPGGQNLQSSGAYFHGDTAMASDIYFAPYRQGGWGTPINLGIDINTPYSERHPIMSRNLKTLYFISDGRGSLGYGDIYMVTRTNVEDWTNWSRPQNVGKEINSGYNEASISFSPDEKQIYLSANSNMGRFTCLSFNTSHDISDSYRSMQLDVLGMESFLHRVKIADLTQQAVYQEVDYWGEGHFIDLKLHKDKRYAILADAGIYFVPSIVIDSKTRSLPTLKGYTFPVFVSLDKEVPLPVVEFVGNSAKMQPISIIQIEQLAQFMERNPDGMVEIAIDVAMSDDTLAYKLAIERGQAIRSELLNHGVSPTQITISPYGNVRVKNTKKSMVAIRMREK